MLVKLYTAMTATERGNRLLSYFQKIKRNARSFDNFIFFGFYPNPDFFTSMAIPYGHLIKPTSLSTSKTADFGIDH